jgi:hypothetical protein
MSRDAKFLLGFAVLVAFWLGIMIWAEGPVAAPQPFCCVRMDIRRP